MSSIVDLLHILHLHLFFSEKFFPERVDRKGAERVPFPKLWTERVPERVRKGSRKGTLSGTLSVQKGYPFCTLSENGSTLPHHRTVWLMSQDFRVWICAPYVPLNTLRLWHVSTHREWDRKFLAFWDRKGTFSGHTLSGTTS